eukprot:TRINITY_DN7575_c0_g2_i1.p1 TRINITY_DN7575_c0_g2~~TRINITY_DN7575_c0_g2_i1.p1  ORF type:complete len:442 (-),score=94.08 TRINITY_DN7575_c0_g2_i1:174-1499(-)
MHAFAFAAGWCAWCASFLGQQSVHAVQAPAMGSIGVNSTAPVSLRLHQAVNISRANEKVVIERGHAHNASLEATVSASGQTVSSVPTHPPDVPATPDIVELENKLWNVEDLVASTEEHVKAAKRNLKRMESNLDVAWAEEVAKHKADKLKQAEDAAEAALAKAKALTDGVAAGGTADVSDGDNDASATGEAVLSSSNSPAIDAPSGSNSSSSESLEHSTEGQALPVSDETASTAIQESILQVHYGTGEVAGDSSSASARSRSSRNGTLVEESNILVGTPWDTSETVEPTEETLAIEAKMSTLDGLATEIAKKLATARQRKSSMQQKLSALRAMAEAEARTQEAADARMEADAAADRAEKMKQDAVQKEAQILGVDTDEIFSGSNTSEPDVGHTSLTTDVALGSANQVIVTPSASTAAPSDSLEVDIESSEAATLAPSASPS